MALRHSAPSVGLAFYHEGFYFGQVTKGFEQKRITGAQGSAVFEDEP